MRDNMKGGALTEVTFYIYFLSMLQKQWYLSCKFIEGKNRWAAFIGSRHFVWCAKLFAGKEMD